MFVDQPVATGQDYRRRAHEIIDRMADSQAGALTEASRAIEQSIRDDGVVQCFGTGHSTSLAMEVAGRAGGLIPTNLLSIRDTVTFGGASADSLHMYSEREPASAVNVFDLAVIQPQDVFIIISNSGANGAIVEMASLAKSNGHTVIAVTSLAHSTQVASRHPSGKRLFELADIVIDNCAPLGDAVIDLPDGSSTGPISSVSAIVALEMIVVDVVTALAREGSPAPIYISANMPGGDEHNDRLTEHYGARVRRTAM